MGEIQASSKNTDYEHCWDAASRVEVSASARYPLERKIVVWTVVLLIILDIAAVLTCFLAEATKSTEIASVTRDIFLGFEFTNEHNIPAWISSMLWAIFGILGLGLAAAAKGRRLGFVAIGVVGLFASLDEYAMIHERLAAVGDKFVPDGIASSIGAWVIPGLLVALFVGLVLLRFVWRLPHSARIRLFIAAVIFLAGSLGAEALWWQLTGGSPEGVTPLALILSGLEENLEILGVAVAIAALSSLIKVVRNERGVRVEVRPDLSANSADKQAI